MRACGWQDNRGDADQMTARTWVGGSAGNLPSYAANWSPAGVPQAGDTLRMTSGVMNVVGDRQLPANQILDAGGSVVINLVNETEA
jgi:hypothetical protein